MIFAIRLTPEQRKAWQSLANQNTDGNVSAMVHLAVATYEQTQTDTEKPLGNTRAGASEDN